MAEEKVYKQLSAGMREELRQIYRQISDAATETGTSGPYPTALFNEASSQLKEVVKTTEDAAMNIMDIVEKQLTAADEAHSLIGEANKKYSDPALAELDKINRNLTAGLTNVLTLLSFQDITGQRLRKVADALGAIEKSVRELYISSGLMLEAAEKDPVKDMQTLQAEAQTAVREFEQKRKSELKGPDSNGISQSSIDDMLSQLGL